MSQAPDTAPVKRGRGRPRKDSQFATVNKEEIARTALEIAGREGFHSLTMHRLAEEFNVTPRALYNYISDRQEVVDLAVERLMSYTPELKLDPADWEESFRNAYRVSRESFRSFPRASLVRMEEEVSYAPGPRRTVLIERLLAFFVEIGLTLRQATVAYQSLQQDVMGYVLQFDYYYDHGDDAERAGLSYPVSAQMLKLHEGTEAPLAQQALELPARDNNEMFEDMVNLRLLAIKAQIEQNQAAS